MSEQQAGGMVEGARKIVQDLVAPELRALIVRVDALEKHLGLKITTFEERSGSRIDAVGQQVNAHIDTVGQQTNARIDAVGQQTNACIDLLTLRVNTLETNMNQRFDAVDRRFESLEKTIKENQAQIMTQFSTLINFNAITERLNRLEEKTKSQTH